MWLENSPCVFQKRLQLNALFVGKDIPAMVAYVATHCKRKQYTSSVRIHTVELLVLDVTLEEKTTLVAEQNGTNLINVTKQSRQLLVTIEL